MSRNKHSRLKEGPTNCQSCQWALRSAWKEGRESRVNAQRSCDGWAPQVARSTTKHFSRETGSFNSVRLWKRPSGIEFLWLTTFQRFRKCLGNYCLTVLLLLGREFRSRARD